MDRKAQILSALRVSAKYDRELRKEIERREVYGTLLVDDWAESLFQKAMREGISVRYALRQMMGFSS